jgi:hypothetical protein
MTLDKMNAIQTLYLNGIFNFYTLLEQDHFFGFHNIALSITYFNEIYF